MLFADVVGFSKLPDASFAGFMSEFLVEADHVLSAPGHSAIVRNTWGDAIFAVFEQPRPAARAALALQRMVAATAWHERFRIAKDRAQLRLRIGLHAGPVHEGYDAITRCPTYMGMHINLAARIEPVAEEGHVYASGEFAAMATVDGGTEFQFDYVGQRPLPKNAGVIPVFRLVAGAVK